MRAFIVLCLVAVACADKLGYNYQPVGHSSSGLSFTPGGSSGIASGGDYSSSSVGGNTGFGGSSGGLSFGGSVGDYSSGASDGGSSYAPQAELEKEFYSFTANEDDFAVPNAESQIANSAKKNLRVIFIKGPENNGLEKAALALAKQAAEQKTAIYVLNKQADISGLAQKLNAINSNVNHKPEVHFVKYRTHEDAINAQKAIQSQYDSLGGSSQNYNGGVAPVINFASKAPVAAPAHYGHIGSSGTGHIGSIGSSGFGGSVGGFSAPTTSYIPPSSSYLPSFIARRYRK